MDSIFPPLDGGRLFKKPKEMMITSRTVSLPSDSGRQVKDNEKMNEL